MTRPRGARVLVVDDEPQIRATVSELLTLEGYEVVQASNGADALKQLDGRPDVVVLDLWMPVLDGWTFRTTQLRTHPGIPVIVLSATTLTEEQLAELGRPAVVAKPFDLDTFLSAIEAAVDGR
jgi:CheY-like chemotaxis protein